MGDAIRFSDCTTRTLAPGVGKKDREAERALRVKRWLARCWMREKGIKDLGRVKSEPQ